ncbi:hypothetical protein JIR001_30930 [Polycladomyces abyssicola]|uniref:Uncharacterized protein n=1 Tax=Polycladomyces abyssicola TaxID=1125966 RepID=A0A8D5ZP15_9BACL|nr:hypothetical protein JIR001_30930 [Polycladomyces abyssicola]
MDIHSPANINPKAFSWHGERGRYIEQTNHMEKKGFLDMGVIFMHLRSGIDDRVRSTNIHIRGHRHPIL